ncbi:hypothetical protein M153_3060004252 [Pseudoloma neurophilia]|uniref:Uncharacterized protein n=1 Tax=Pseudoloma neurophilia TaxID=146866 RepID=A0A0R0LYV3_9MICR|nr:hypothetical protein M153_3060004252 [Pseudoloma neurophilia]
MLRTFFYLPWIILLINTHPLGNNETKITNNPPVSNSNEQVLLNPSMSDPKDQFETDPTILSDPSKPLFKNDERINCVPSLFNVLLRLLNDDFFNSLKGKDDELAVNMLKLRKEALKNEKNQESVNKLTNNLVEFLEIKCSPYYKDVINKDMFYFLKYFLTYIVESNLDQDKKYFCVGLKDETAVFYPESASDNRTLPLFFYTNLIINGDHMSFYHGSKWVFTKKPKLIFLYYPSIQIFNKNRKKHLKIQHEDKTDKSKTVYNLKSIVFWDKNMKYNSFFIQNDKFYDQKTGGKQSITTAEISYPRLLIYELSE